ncbi:integrase arm-type DNA-binding domain-containing protein [Mesorhizobium sp. LHD-90]|uniref:tyrosine-type recombinase/integrase n=1 Tax=Mesorhizobium sp. LHD-90 TaxID=3071414 RepID=UPI0027E1A514|nr:integrase arm-type DNA-binding domain-containing protein [Mesorhizobium sp. LHD-90]MDQ6433774.1 integrase arm-type DNA-binding domain-containing protein [Mesorhizobium sp. LHD-90]
MTKLSDTWLRRTKIDNGIYGDGDRLYLRVQGNARSWLFIYTSKGKRRELGLGGYPAVGLKDARKKAGEVRNRLTNGKDPIAEKREELTVLAKRTLGEVCEAYIKVNESGWTPNVAARYRAYIKNHIGDTRSMLIEDITTDHIETVLMPSWDTPTGEFLRSFLERVFDYAMVKGYLPRGFNVARYKGNLKHIMPKVKRTTRHHAAMAWQEVPALMRWLERMCDADCATGSRSFQGVGAMALRLTILCALRQVEARELRWCDVKADRIVIPAERYKTRREHVVPLSDAAKAIIDEAGRGSNRDPDALVFAGRLAKRPLSQHIFSFLLNDLGSDATVHGFRTSFAVWCVEGGGFSDDIAQRCLGHVVGTAVGRAYQRSDFFDAKLAALQGWGKFLIGDCPVDKPRAAAMDTPCMA